MPICMLVGTWALPVVSLIGYYYPVVALELFGYGNPVVG